MKNYFVLFLLVSILFISCSEKNVNEPVIIDDSELLSQIIGTWKSNTYKITYFSDLTFVDTIYNQDENTQILEPLYSRNGEYEIQDGILYLKTEHWTFFDSSYVENGISIIPFETEINISGNILYKKAVDVLERTEGTGNEIWGSWKNMKWTYHHSSPDTNIVYEGRQEYYYRFYKDSSKVTYGWKYLDGNPWSNPEYRSDFNYTPPFLDLNGPGNYDLRVEFKFGKMFWYYNFNPSQMYRQN